MPLAVVYPALVVSDDHLPAAQVVGELHVAVLNAQRQEVAGGGHLLLAGPEQQAVRSHGAKFHLNVDLLTTHSGISNMCGAEEK